MSQVSDQTDQMTGERPAMVVGAGVMIRGDIEGPTDLHVLGQIVGRIAVTNLLVGPHGLIEGPVSAEAVTVGGCVVGPIDAGSVHLSDTARVEGDVACGSIQIDTGARLIGRCSSREAAKEKVVSLFGRRDDSLMSSDASEELMKMVARLRQLRE